MASPNMAAITASLERTFQKFSLNDSNSDEGTEKSTPTTSSTPNHHHNHHNHHRHDRRLENANDTTLELNSHISLPYHWEQCLDLKTGEIYYINWRTGTKATEDPRTSVNEVAASSASGDYYYDEDDDNEDEEESPYDSEESSSENSSLTARARPEARAGAKEDHGDEMKKSNAGSERQEVLVVGGCKGCFMYFMVPKHVHDCPKCCGQLLHFDRSQNGSL